MKYCKHCGKPTEDDTKQHADCAELSAKGWSDAQISAKVSGWEPANVPGSAPRPLTRGDIVFGVFWGVLLASLVVGVFTAVIAAVLAPSHPTTQSLPYP
jgi:hypothetical protein